MLAASSWKPGKPLKVLAEKNRPSLSDPRKRLICGVIDASHCTITLPASLRVPSAVQLSGNWIGTLSTPAITSNQ
jgi:hypothetical protein